MADPKMFVDFFPPYAGYSFVGPDNLHTTIYPAIDPSTNKDLHQPGKVVFITGASRGLGRSIALQYAHASVATIILCARTVSGLQEVSKEISAIDSKIKVVTYELDVTDDAGIKKCAEDVKSSIGRLDILINNAGSTCPWTSIEDSEPGSWWSTVDVNLRGPYLFTHAFMPLLKETARANSSTVDVITLSSICAHADVPGSSAYQIAKMAVCRFSEFVQSEYGEAGVNAFALGPGVVNTALAESVEVIKPFCIDAPELPGGFSVWLTKEDRKWLGGRYVAATWDVDALEKMKEEIVSGNKLKVKLIV